MRFLAVLFAVFAGAQPCYSSGDGLDPSWIEIAVSRDGDCRLSYQRSENGTAIRCSISGRERWRRHLGLIPDDAYLTNGGQAVLTGSRRGREFERGRRNNYFVIAILDSHGQLLQYQHVMQRWGSGRRCFASKPYPHSEGLIVDAATNVAVIRLASARRGSGEWWWLFRLSSGELIGDLHPWDVVKTGWPGELELKDARLIPGSPLVATLWSTSVCNSAPGSTAGDTLVLLGLRGGTHVHRSLAGLDRTSCAFLESVAPETIRLRAFDGVPLEFSISRDSSGKVELVRR